MLPYFCACFSQVVYSLDLTRALALQCPCLAKQFLKQASVRPASQPFAEFGPADRQALGDVRQCDDILSSVGKRVVIRGVASAPQPGAERKCWTRQTSNSRFH